VDFKREFEKTEKYWDVFEKLFDELGIKHEGAFYDCDIKTVFVRCQDCYQNGKTDSDSIKKAMGIPLTFRNIDVMGLVTDKDPMDRCGGGWIYFNIRAIKREL